MRANIEEFDFILQPLKKNCQFLKRNISLQAFCQEQDTKNGEVAHPDQDIVSFVKQNFTNSKSGG